ncbi:porin [Burkholderia sp. Ac-20379]|uniref:porin n=1 Tax=Burkholderia sp. Ac-20379 TaxID=2703900 RepID=UPI00197FC6D9|nr:porin [Burkholderia sp. Ac-20379]MBN3727520.1 porin [Burkholderia sp. Ac-20379]
MKRLAPPLFASVLAAVSSHALAQSTVTLYGIVDEGITYGNNVGGGAQVAAASGTMSGSRFGLKGTEDLGGGMSAVFDLQNGFDLSTGKLGQGGRMFGRKAFVGLSSATYGALTLGRQYDPVVDLVQGITGDGVFGAFFTTPGDADNNDNSIRVNNSIKYTSPTYAGLTFEAMYGLGGTAGSVSSGGSMGAALGYTNGGLNLAGGYLYTKNDTLANASSGGFINDGSLVTAGYGVAPGSFQTIHAAASYAFNKFTVGLRYSNSQYKTYSQTSVFNATEKFNVASGYLAYQFTPALMAAVNYGYTKASGAQSASYNQVSAGVDYLLSKRTDLYAIAGYTKANGRTLSADGTTVVAATANVGDYNNASSNAKQVLAVVGMRHKF